MYPPLPPCIGLEIMLGDALGRLESSLDDVENSRPSPAAPARPGLNASRRVLLKKGARRVRTANSLQNKHGQNQNHHHQQQQRQPGLLRTNTSQTRLADINNNNSSSSSAVPRSAAELPAGRTGTHFRTGAKKELLKSKTGRVERGNQANGQNIHSLNKHEQSPPNLNARSQKSKFNNIPGSIVLARKCESNQQSNPLFCLASRREGKRPLSSSDTSRNANECPAQPLAEESLKDGEKTYAGAKFSEPPSPSVLPKPPSHWVGENSPKHSSSSREQMSVHLKTLLKVQAEP